MVGSGRSFNQKGFLQKLDEIEGYIISDVESFPKIKFWIINKSDVIKWWKKGDLNATTKISRTKILKILEK